MLNQVPTGQASVRSGLAEQWSGLADPFEKLKGLKSLALHACATGMQLVANTQMHYIVCLLCKISMVKHNLCI